MSYDEFKKLNNEDNAYTNSIKLSNDKGSASINASRKFRELIEQVKSKSNVTFLPKQFVYLLKHLQDASHRQELLNQVSLKK